jgi:hypothetical protein
MANPLSPPDVSDALAAPLGDLIAAVGRGMAEAQQSLDLATIETIRALYTGSGGDAEVLRRFGYQPTWYRIPELHAEITLSLSVHGSAAAAGVAGPADAQGSPGRIRLYVVPMDANYTNRYDYDLNAASVIKFKIVPVPPTVQAADLRLVPRLADLRYDEARQRLASLGIPFELDTTRADGMTVKSTVPGPGEFLAPGQKVKLEF